MGDSQIRRESGRIPRESLRKVIFILLIVFKVTKSVADKT